jgi:hypothetical protein
VLETQAIRDKIFEEFDNARNSEQCDSLLAIFKATMDIAQVYVAKSGTPERLARFNEARATDYARLLLKESTVGDRVSPETLLAVTSRENKTGRLTPDEAVTNREIAAGRLTPDDPIRQLATKAVASPHPSHAELLAKTEARKASDMSI